jgi:site-specific DNA recombinase
VSEDDLRKLRALLSDPARRTNQGRLGRVHLLSGIITCGRCGNQMRWGKTTTRAGIPYELYQCTGGLDGCRSSILKEIAEEEVIKVIATRLAFPSTDLLEATAADRERLDEIVARRAELDAEAKALDSSPDLSRASRIKFTAEIDREAAQLSAEWERLLRRVHLADMFSELTLPKMGKEEGIGGFSVWLAAQDIAMRFSEAPLEKRQAIVRALVSVKVLPAHKGVRPTKELARQRVDVTPLNVVTGEPLHA